MNAEQSWRYLKINTMYKSLKGHVSMKTTPLTTGSGIENGHEIWEHVVLVGTQTFASFSKELPAAGGMRGITQLKISGSLILTVTVGQCTRLGNAY